VDREKKAKLLLNGFRERLAPVENVHHRPRVYFEEWDAPLVSGIAWVSELIQRAGGVDIFRNLSSNHNAAERLVAPLLVCMANPEIILASWCGKPVDIEQIVARPGWSDITAAREGRIYEIPGNDILQPGFQLIQGYERIKQGGCHRLDAPGNR
jgi:iron complex transport system substrate-binding protein